MVQNKGLVFKEIPQGYPEPGKHLVVETREIDLKDVPKNGFITKNRFVSFDPYLRGKMRDAHIKSYASAIPLNSVLTNGGVATIAASNTPDFAVGDLIVTQVGIEEYSVFTEERIKASPLRKLENKYNLPLSNFTGALGMPGLTAYSSYYKIGQPKQGETIFISAASGAVGQLVGQLAKRDGLRVVGSAGSEEKVRFLKGLGFDEAFNYKTIRPGEALKKYAAEGIDIYYDNVGGETLEAAIDAANNGARFVECGMISQYNISSPEDAYYPKNLMYIVTKRLLVQGFIVSDKDFGPAYWAEHQQNVQKWLADGSVIAKEHITEGIDNAAEGLVEIFHGKNFGKAVLKISD